MRASLALAALVAAGSLAVAADADPVRLKGQWELWEDHEGGTVCALGLDNAPAIGGFALEGSEACLRTLKLKGDPYAWFLDPQGNVVLIDATRKAVLRLDRLDDGSFYAQRREEGLENLNLTPKN